jgi:hypothetical protein
LDAFPWLRGHLAPGIVDGANVPLV